MNTAYSNTAPSCPVCASVATRTLYPMVKDYVTHDSFQVYSCDACGVGFTHPQPKEIGKYYQTQYRRYIGAILTILKTMYGVRSRQWSRLFPMPGAVLEVGCGDGYMLNSLRTEGWRTFGIERTPDMAEFARTRLGLEIYTTGVEEIPEEIQFDLIILFQVLEHIHDPATMLTGLAQRLTPNGKLIIGVPNFGSWQRRFAGEHWFHLDIPRHLVHFSPESLASALDQVGMKVERIRYASLEHDPYGWVQSTLNKVLGDENRLTRLLMRMDKLTPYSTLTLGLLLILAFPALCLSVVSWLFRRGALMEVTAVRV